ncbi:hypothetical protein BCR32DRAFT_325304 [Anaeromyces robustus]|uniref:Knr4/Smi1-like domain-containing protein n=1 Tax=Anaeromyces robustus TaxID=1754192 RepID=A0A1Y1XIY0_9FUNG|nr:hypothetical protein BCR32DRAFT_325304 [Anaeromyces robustus]|eukprot:ORX85709.1 hypothetical protein BCR32DRAFT_325304 [Anaeromyces robustus]
MDNFINFLKENDDGGAHFTTATKADLNKLLDLGKGHLSTEFIDFYTRFMPKKDVKIRDIKFFPVDKIEEENSLELPGAALYLHDFLTFATVSHVGDVVCLDLKDGSIYQCEHTLFADPNEPIEIYLDTINETINLPINHENIAQCSVKLADNFVEFTNSLIDNEWVAYDVFQYLTEMYQ